MSVLNHSLLLGAPAAAGGYQISRSLRFNSSDSAFCSRTFTTPTANNRWTWAGWVKRVNTPAVSDVLFSANYSSGLDARLSFLSDNTFYYSDGGGGGGSLQTTSVYRDFSAWMHVVFVYDSPNATSSDRLQLYINGTRITTSNGLGSTTYPAQNTVPSINGAKLHSIGQFATVGGYFANFYLADIHFIDGQALTPSSFGQFDANGIWQPKAYTGTYGTNGFRLAFSDNSTAAALGTDSSGNGNTWTVNNISVAAGAGNDSLVDSPTNYGTDTGAGGEVRGNYATFNPINLTPSSSHALTNGNLEVIGGTGWTSDLSTFPTGSTGKWYAEITLSGTFATSPFVGIAQNTSITSSYIGSQSTSYGYRADATKYNNGGSASYGATFGAGDTIGIAYDADAGTLVFYKNGVSQGTAYTGLSGSFFIGGSFWTSSTTVNAIANFGQRPFAYPVSGFKALCTTNLPAPLVAQPSTAFDVKLWNGNSGTQSITGLQFSPDLVWIKGRVGTLNHVLSDTIRGANLKLASNTTSAEAGTDNGTVSAFNSDGFTVAMGTGTYAGYETNLSGYSYAGWCWDAGSSTVTNTQGSITSSVRANASAGFSVLTWTGQSAAGTIGHGLGVAPSLIICKARSNAQSWGVYHKDVGINSYLLLDSTGAATALSGIWGSSAPTSTVFGVPGNVGLNNNNGWTYVAYCFAPVAGYSSFGSYTGNGSSDGPFVWTGFRPRWVMVKNTSLGTANDYWVLFDGARNGYNTTEQVLIPNLSDAEGTSTNNGIDLLSNGFKWRATHTSRNASGSTYIYAAFAESPFQFARAR